MKKHTTRHPRLLAALTLAIICLSVSTPCLSQLDFAPTSVILSSDVRSTTILVRNTGNDDREIEVAPFFGYAVTDSNGGLTTQRNDTLKEARYSVLPYIRFFPRKFNLSPGGEQLVKFVVTPRPDMRQGAYWARLTFRSKPTSRPIEQTIGDSVQLHFNMVLERVTALVYFNLPFAIGVDVSDFKIQKDSALHLAIPFHAKGDSPFWGRASIKIKDENGNIVDEKAEMLAIYFGMIRRYDFDTAKVQSGRKYIAELSVNAEREELPSKLKDTFSPIEKRFEFVAP